MTETRYGNMRIFRFIIIVFMILMVGMLTATVKSHAGSWHEVYLNPGQTYNVSDAGWNTTVYINKAGSYTLKGESTKCKVVIKSGGVNVYLEDGLEIDPGIKANIGVATAGLIIEDMSGTVKLISKKGADAYIGGYLMAPAIEKVGYNSKLVFETIDPANPGTITAYRSHASNSAGIGSAYRFSVPVTTGNIEINSGTLIATGGYMSAGIGGGGGGSAHKIIINGGNVKAAGGSHGTGIGGGFHGNASNITINGGTVKATSIGEGAGIGSGEQSKYAKNIVINGGNITAVSDLGAGIGGGQRSEVENLRINGGTIYAYSRKTGIGSSCDQHLGILKSLYITGGNIVAESKGVAIGAAEQSPGPNNIYISGGNIQAKSDWIAIGGGGFSSVTDDTRITNVTISGGTIQADGGDVHFGTGAWMDQFNIIITGGSILAECDKMDSAPKDQFGKSVKRTDITIDGMDKVRYKVQDTDISGISTSYGINDVYTQNGKVYFWIPDNAVVKTATMPGNNVYRGSVSAGESGTLYKDTTVIIESDGEDLKSGSGTLYKGTDKINNLIAPKIREGYTLTGYKIKGTSTLIADVDGKLKPSVTSNGVDYTDADGKWIREGSTRLEFVAATEENSYTIAFDANPPENTKSTPYLNGNMDSVTVKYTQSYKLPDSKFTLKGYTFAGWATTPDLPEGSNPLKVGDSIASLVPSGTATLYAQWTPQKYTVTFNANGGIGTMEPQEMTYDQAANLNSNTFTKEGHRFIGWMRSGVAGGTLRADGAAVVNLCNCNVETNKAQGYTLKAQWVPVNQPAVMVTLNGEPKGDFEVHLVPTPNDDDAASYGLKYDEGSRIYTVTGSDSLPNGNYEVRIGDKATGKTITIGGENANTYAAVEYYSVSFDKDGNIKSTTEYMGQVLAGTKVEISAATKEGYKFDKWVAIECAPEYVNSTASSASATIKVNEKTTLKATSKPIAYQVDFNGNRPEGTSSEFDNFMFEQHFVYDTAQKLHKNEYTLKGYTFTGWNTAADGSGTSYSDGAEVMNLTSEDEGVVILYAQWEADDYIIHFHGNGAAGKQMADLDCVYDKEFEVPRCEYSKEDYHFLGWCSEIDGIGTYYYPGDEVKNLASEDGAVVVLYAVWEHDQYNVSFDANGGEGQVPDVQIWTEEEYILSNPGFIKQDHVLVGWNTEADGSGRSYVLDEKVKDIADVGESIVLYAQWEYDPEASGDGETGMPDGSDNDSYDETDTGDKAPIGLIAGIMLAALGVIATVLFGRRRRTE